jgi:mono/diheme cytochrome c family protein
VAPGPAGVAVDEESGRAVVFSQMGGAVQIVNLDNRAEPPKGFALDYHPDPALAHAARGRLLFYRTDDTRIAIDGLACSSCHMDGRDDAITWATPSGPRQTPMLAGRLANTAPYGWEGERATLHEYIQNTVTNLGGRGISDEDLADLSEFLLTLDGPSGPAPAFGRSMAERDASLFARGQELFESPEQGCSSCHSGSVSTDTMVHDMENRKAPVDTPSLHFLRGTAPYFHDGRYATLDALLGDLTSPMGHSASLPEWDRVALAVYLRSL